MTIVAERAALSGEMQSSLPGRILPLSAEAIAQIHSSKHITSLGGVVLALLENGLDARADRVEISVDWRRGDATVCDNGIGIPSTEFEASGSLGKLYCTSKRPLEGLESSETHGSSGTFLAELATMSLLSITSTHIQSQGAAAGLTLHHGKVITRRLPDATAGAASVGQHQGTDVIVRDLFGNMPVRIKQRALAGDASYEDDKSWNELKRGVVALLLAWPRPCSVKLRDMNFDSRTVNISRHHPGAPNALTTKSLHHLAGRHVKSDVRDALPVLFQSGLALPDSRSKWIPLCASSSTISLKGLICLDPAPTKQCQFLSLGITPCSATSGHNELYDVAAKVFSNSSFGMVEEPNNMGSHGTEKVKATHVYTSKTLQAKKRVDRFPMYYIQLKFKDRGHSRDHDRLSDSSLKAVVDILDAALTTWLETNHLRPRKKRRRRNEEQEAPSGLVRSVRLAGQETTAQLEQGDVPGTAAAPQSDTRGTIIDLSERPLTRDFALQQDMAVNCEDLSALSSMRAGRTINRPQTAEPSSRRGGEGGTQRAESATCVEPQTIDLTMPVKKRRTLKAPGIDAGVLGGFSKAPPSPVEPPAPSQTSGPNKSVRRGREIPSSDNFGSIDEDVLLSAEQGACQASSERPPFGGDGPDDDVTWTDPVSQQVFRVNTRTGVVVPLSDERQLASATSTRQRAAIDVSLSSMGKPLSLARRSAIADNESEGRSSTAEDTAWLPGFLKQWNNPVFARQKEEPIPVASFDGPGPLETDANGKCCSHTHLASRLDDSSNGTKLTRPALRAAEVIAQVDNKFILCKVPASSSRSGEKTTLLLVDQHAASERVILENLFTELCTLSGSDATSIQTTSLRCGTARAQALLVEISANEIDLFARYRAHFARWGVLYDLLHPERPTSGRAMSEVDGSRIRVTHLPTPVAERCANFPSLAIEMLRSEVWALADGSRKVASDVQRPIDEGREDDQTLWLSLLSAIPPSLVALLHSRSCRSAIMFNDVLSQGQCEDLVGQLGKCVFPFVCAHGRTSMVPLGDIGVVDAGSEGGPRESEGQAMKAWLSSRKPMRAEDAVLKI